MLSVGHHAECRRALTLTALFGSLLTVSAHAFQGMPTPPKINVTNHTRSVSAMAGAHETDQDFQESMASNTGPFRANLSASAVGTMGASADAASEHDSVVSTFFIKGDGQAQASATGTFEAPGLGTGDATVQVTFEVPVDASFQLTAEIDTDGSGPFGGGQVSVVLNATAADGSLILISHTSGISNGFEPVTINEFGMLMAGSPATLSVFAQASAQGDGVSTVVAEATYEFRLDLGDRDGDGLLNEWEEMEGIDIDADGMPDLPLVGADPDHKDVFVEYDVMSGFAPPAGALDDVVARFGEVPEALVDNPDMADGVTLHFVDGEDLISDTSTWDDDWTGFNAAKALHFGLPSEREPNPDAEDLRDARLQAYRYCIFANRNTTSGKTGRGELPGNDFMVYIGAFNAGQDPSVLRKKIASTTMHELGHTLGLRHGGGDNILYKPNYISIMNYSFQLPKGWLLNLNAWRMDYSRDRLPSLDEGDLSEPDGLMASGTHYAGLQTYWNAAPLSDPPEPVKLRRDAVGTQPINWNALGMDDETGVELDLNYMKPSRQDPSPGEILNGHCDWCGLWYHLSGTMAFEDGVTGTGVESPDEIPREELEALVDSVLPICAADVNGDGVVDINDLLDVLAAWGACADPSFCPEDTNNDDVVDIQDLLDLLAAWGACS